MPLPKDPVRAEQTRKRMSESSKKIWENPEHRKKMSELHTGKKQSQETIDKRTAKIKGKLRTSPINKKCVYCGKEFTVPKYRENTAKFCSLVCKGRWQSENAVGEQAAHWQGGQIIKKCTECGKEFTVENNRENTAKFCSQKCKGIWRAKNELLPEIPHFTGENHPNWKGGDIIKKCEICGKDFLVKHHYIGKTRFCSLICKGKWQSKNLVGEANKKWKRTQRTCIECGKIFYVKTRRKETGKFCSMACHGKWNSKNRVGENSPSWLGGKKDYCEKWNSFLRTRIRAFFNHKCVLCGTPQDEELLHCHHVYYDKKACCTVSKDGKYFTNLGVKDNLPTFEIVGNPNKFVALCRRCHSMTTGKNKREFWARYYENLINNQYLGKSFFTKEEYEKIN